MGRRQDVTYLNGEKESSSNQIQGRNITEDAPQPGQGLAWDDGINQFVYDAGFMFLDAGDATTSSWDFGSPIDGSDATATSFPAISNGGISNTF